MLAVRQHSAQHSQLPVSPPSPAASSRRLPQRSARPSPPSPPTSSALQPSLVLHSLLIPPLHHLRSLTLVRVHSSKPPLEDPLSQQSLALTIRTLATTGHPLLTLVLTQTRRVRRSFLRMV